MSFKRLPYTGSRKLVIAFDIGTTCSGVSYALLDPGIVPEIKSVGRFLDNRLMSNFKVPSVLYYGHDGTFHGVKGTIDDDEADNLHEIRWWKLKLASGELPAAAKKHITPALPKGKTLQGVFADFIRYLYDSTKAFFQEAEPTGEELWKNFESKIDLILSHPNGWGSREQEFMRKAVVQASIFTEEEALSHVSFVTEGEATFSYCVTNTQSRESLRPGHKVFTIDAGGGTIDISSYNVTSTSPLEVEEFVEQKCFYQGGEVVTSRAREYAEEKLKGSKFGNKQDLKAFTENFDTAGKANFADSNKLQFVKFGSLRDKDGGRGVKDGKLTIPGPQFKEFFEPSVSAIVQGIQALKSDADPSNTFIFFSGGFAASPWMFKEVGRRIAADGFKLSRPDPQMNKPVAVGAISYYLDHLVVGRIVRYTYGTPAAIPFDQKDPEHRDRVHKMFLGVTGQFQLNVFDPTLLKGTRTSGAQEFREKVAGISPSPPADGKFLEFPVIRYTGTSKNPLWMDEEEDNYKTLSRIRVDAKKVPFIPVMSPLGFPVFVQEFEVIYIYGGTAEIKAQIAWKEDGVEMRSNIAIVHDDE